jgi:hypothetical protein
MSVVIDPLAQRERVRELVPTIEALATEYANQCEPVRAELNRLLALPEAEWLEGLYSAGSVLAPLELWEYEPPPDVRASPKTHARYAIRQLFSAATACDDQLFRARFQRLQRDHMVANAAIAERTEAVDSLFLCCLKHAHDATVDQFRAALATVGLEPTLSLKDDFRRCGGEFSPVAHAAISHWLDRSGPSFCRVGNRALMIGEGYAPPSVQPPTDEPARVPEEDDIQVRLRAIAERKSSQAATPAPADSASDEHEEGQNEINAADELVAQFDKPLERVQGQKNRRIPFAEACTLVADYIAKHDPSPTAEKNLTVRRISGATGVSVGQMPNIPAWREYQDRKCAESGGPRAVPLSDEMLASLPSSVSDAGDPAEEAANNEVLEKLLKHASSEDERSRYLAMTPGERWRLLELITEQVADAKRDKRRPARRRVDCS